MVAPDVVKYNSANTVGAVAVSHNDFLRSDAVSLSRDYRLCSFFSNGGRRPRPAGRARRPSSIFCGCAMDLSRFARSETISAAFRRAWCPTGNIANTAIRTAAKNAKSSPATVRLKKKPLARAHCRCRARIRSPVARSAALCSARYPNQSENVRSAALNCTLAGNAHISTLRAGLSVRSRFRNAFREKTSAMNVRFIR